MVIKLSAPGEAPHRVVHRIVVSILDIPISASESITSAMDKGPLTDKGPHRGVNEIVKGSFEAIQIISEGITRALDRPIEALGKPPEIFRR